MRWPVVHPIIGDLSGQSVTAVCALATIPLWTTFWPCPSIYSVYAGELMVAAQHSEAEWIQCILSIMSPGY